METGVCSLPQAKVNERVGLESFYQLAGQMGGYPFVKLVVHRKTGDVHFINNHVYEFHVDYIAENIIGVPRAEIRRTIDEFNEKTYLSPDREYMLGILSYHTRDVQSFFAFETVEIDNMNAEMIESFYRAVRDHVDPAMPLLFKPANHSQEQLMAQIDPTVMPRVFHHELFSTADFIPLNPGETKGRLRLFTSEDDYKRRRDSLEWFDIIVMDRVPDDIPRISGIINARHTTPLSHTNVLATGWEIPNAVQIGIQDEIASRGLDEAWVHYNVAMNASRVGLVKAEAPHEPLARPSWSVQSIRLEEPETENTPIVSLDELRMSDRFRYGTKAANLGELRHILRAGSRRLTGFYRIPRPPRQNLLPYLARYLGASDETRLEEASWQFLRAKIQIPRGIAIPFSVQQEFLESSPQIQQTIGKLKMALALGAKEIDPLCLQLQNLIRKTRFTDKLRDYIDSMIATHLAGVSSFVVRSSSNAEDLENFSAAGIYESINHVTTASKIFESIREVWTSLVSPRSVRLRSEVGISLDDSYMGVVVQEEVEADIGGVLVTTNPMNPRGDFRNVYINVAPHSAVDVVSGNRLPYQYLYNTLEGGGRTLSLGSASSDLDDTKKRVLQELAFAGRLLQSHFAGDYTFNTPADIEWAAKNDTIYILQLRPYAV